MGASRGKPIPAAIGRVLRDSSRLSLLVFSEPLVVRDSNEAELLAIRRAPTLWVDCGYGKLIIEGNLANAIKWARA